MSHSKKSNGVKQSAFLHPGSRIRRDELTRLMAQGLRDLGLLKSAEMVEEESGLSLESPHVKTFRKNILSGDFDHVETLLDSLGVQEESKSNVKFLLRRQKYLEALEAQDVDLALTILRTELTPLNINTSDIHHLSSLMMCSNVQDLKSQAQWDGANGDSRHQLLMSIQAYISAEVMIPERRLEKLLEQAVELQKMDCLYHNSEDKAVSLFVDHQCSKEQFPSEVIHVLEEHSDEVWYIAFSHDGRFLASASKDTTAIVWSTDNFQPIHVLNGHSEAVSFLAFNHDDTKLLTCSNDKSLRVWNLQTGRCELRLARHTDAVTACAWMANGQMISGSLDKHIHIWNTNGEVIQTFFGVRTTDLAVTADGKYLVAVCHEKKIRIYDLEEKKELGSIQESDSITSLCLSRDSKFALVNLSSQEIHLWNLHEKRLVKKYVGQKQGRFVIRSCFAGLQETFVVSGSEDSNLYVWNREHSLLLDVLSGHSATVNSVASRRQMLASASDDNTIRIWASKLMK